LSLSNALALVLTIAGISSSADGGLIRVDAMHPFSPSKGRSRSVIAWSSSQVALVVATYGRPEDRPVTVTVFTPDEDGRLVPSIGEGEMRGRPPTDSFPAISVEDWYIHLLKDEIGEKPTGPSSVADSFGGR
jgi:hypothetical protein